MLYRPLYFAFGLDVCSESMAAYYAWETIETAVITAPVVPARG